MANDLKDPLNIGSLFRLADSFAVNRFYLTGNSPTPPHPKIRKTSRHTDSTVTFEQQDDPIAILTRLKETGTTIISLELTTKSIPVQQLELLPQQPICLIVGAENSGVSQPLLDASDLTVHIPMYGNNSSMNVVSACAIALYEIANQVSSHTDSHRL